MNSRAASATTCKISFLLLTLPFLTNCERSSVIESGAMKVENRPSVQVKDLPAKFLDPVDLSSKSSAAKTLGSQDSLTLDGTTLTVGQVGANGTVTLAFNTLRMIHGARIITSGNHLTIAALNLDFNDSGGIDSFAAESLKAPLATQGSDGGRVEIYALKNITGSLRIALPGQNGGDGKPGAAGGKGSNGGKGNGGSDQLFGCGHGGDNGGQGGTGLAGGPGGAGSDGGNGGELFLRVSAATSDHVKQFPFEARGGLGGTGGAGGAGGPGGDGGQGGDGSTYCKGGQPGMPGAAGAQGPPGPNGNNGKSSNTNHLLEQ